MRSKDEPITGDQLRALREALGMETFVFAMLLGVHVSTVYRWESKGSEAIQMDPLQRELLSKLVARFKKTHAKEKSALGQALVAGLISGGAVAGLLVLLKFLTNDEPKPNGDR